MGIINVLDKQTANLIAAGEVVERPSSAIKEMLENCADAGATAITVEIKNGGTSFIRVTDNGCGMTREDVPKCIMRHATSKIKTGSDLEAIGTFGFRGEALAAISSVARVRILTKSKNDDVGTLFECDFGEQVTLEDAGCPDGTTITVENIFENVPARRKFLKKDSTEAISVTAACEKFALSRCEIALTLISDNNVKLQTPGNGDLKSAIYACLGRDFASAVTPVDYILDNIRVHGFIAKPEFSRPNRNMQNFFVNYRFIRSRTMMAAVEEGFRGFCPTGKFPACVLFCDIDLRLVDINVHPAKLEIKFSDERRVFDAVYFSVKNALTAAVRFSGFTEDACDNEVFPIIEKTPDKPLNNSSSTTETAQNISSKVQIGAVTENVSVSLAPTKDVTSITANNQAVDSEKLSSVQKSDTNISVTFKKEQVINTVEVEKTPKEPVRILNFLEDDYTKTPIIGDNKKTANENAVNNSKNTAVAELKITSLDDDINSSNVADSKLSSSFTQDTTVDNAPQFQNNAVQKQQEFIPEANSAKPICIGEVFDTYIICQFKNSLYLIDKHAAHERIIYERLKKNDYENGSQYLLEPISVNLTPKEAEAASENRKYFEKIGFEFDDFGLNSFIIRSLPTPIAQSDAKDVFTFLAGKLSEGNSRSAGEIFDRALFTAACRAAIKAGDKNTDMDNMYIANEIFNNEAVLYCPHGRPVIYEFTKQKLDKMFDRL